MVLPEAKQAKLFLDELLTAVQQDHLTERTTIQHQIAASAACRAAVMAGDSMAPQEVTRLIEELSACERPMTCPHGRPTHIRFAPPPSFTAVSAAHESGDVGAHAPYRPSLH